MFGSLLSYQFTNVERHSTLKVGKNNSLPEDSHLIKAKADQEVFLAVHLTVENAVDKLLRNSGDHSTNDAVPQIPATIQPTTRCHKSEDQHPNYTAVKTPQLTTAFQSDRRTAATRHPAHVSHTDNTRAVCLVEPRIAFRPAVQPPLPPPQTPTEWVLATLSLG